LLHELEVKAQGLGVKALKQDDCAWVIQNWIGPWANAFFFIDIHESFFRRMIEFIDSI